MGPLTDTVYTLCPSFRHTSLHALVNSGFPAGMKVYPGGALASNDIWQPTSIYVSQC